MATRTINIKQLRKLLKQTRVSQPFVTRRDNRKFDRNSQQFIIHFHDHNIIVNLYDSLTTVFYDFMTRKGENLPKEYSIHDDAYLFSGLSKMFLIDRRRFNIHISFYCAF